MVRCSNDKVNYLLWVWMLVVCNCGCFDGEKDVYLLNEHEERDEDKIRIIYRTKQNKTMKTNNKS